MTKEKEYYMKGWKDCSEYYQKYINKLVKKIDKLTIKELE